MPLNQRFRRLTELFVSGQAVPMPDGTHLWVQAINSYERNECISDAQVARARTILALKDDGRERVKVEGRLAEIGLEAMAEDLASAQASGKTQDYADEMRVDPEWKERMDIVLRTDPAQAATPSTPEEDALMARINAEVLAEWARREEEEKEFLRRKFLRMSDDDFIEAWIEEWFDRRGGDQATAEFRLTEIWYATRFCDAVLDKDGEPDHGPCNGHRSRVFETKQDARSAPDALQDLLRTALDELNFEGRDPKDSANPPSSSGSSPTPSEAEESTPSTSTETPPKPPGTSAQPSPTA